MENEIESKAEKTIEEILVMTTERLIRLTPDELSEYMGDCLTRQEEILGKVPRTSAIGRAINLNSSSPAAKRAERNMVALLPDEDQAAYRKAQEAYNKLKKTGFIK